MRGKDVITKDGKTYARITPAYAGKSPALPWCTAAL